MPIRLTAKIALLVALFLGAALPAARAEEGARFKAMSFNIRYDSGEESRDRNAWVSRNGLHRRDLVFRLIDETNPDILGLQEVLPNQRRDLAAHLEGYEGYGVGRDDGVELGEQCAIFVRTKRFEVLDRGTFWLCDTPDQAGAKHPDAACVRVASWVKLADRQANSRELWVVNSHWDHVSQPARQQAAEVIREQMATMIKSAPALLMGDFNAAERSSEIAALLAAGSEEPPRLKDAYRLLHPERTDQEASFQGFTPRTKGHRIDYVLTTPDFAPQSAKILTTSYEGRMPSDHYPVVVELQWKGE